MDGGLLQPIKHLTPEACRAQWSLYSKNAFSLYSWLQLLDFRHFHTSSPQPRQTCGYMYIVFTHCSVFRIEASHRLGLCNFRDLPLAHLLSASSHARVEHLLYECGREEIRDPYCVNSVCSLDSAVVHHTHDLCSGSRLRLALVGCILLHAPATLSLLPWHKLIVSEDF